MANCLVFFPKAIGDIDKRSFALLVGVLRISVAPIVCTKESLQEM
jgi:hypothetical protein